MVESHQDWLERKIMEPQDFTDDGGNTLLDVPVMDNLTYEQKLRIEALRAAARVVAALAGHEEMARTFSQATAVDITTGLAKQFHRYLETGE